jgi:hypothetical protein
VPNVDTTFSCLSPENRSRLYQFVLGKISCESTTTISRRNFENWEECKEFLRNTYIEKTTLDFHANQLFKAKQNRAENVSEWIATIQSLGSKFGESALKDYWGRTCGQSESVGWIKEYIVTCFELTRHRHVSRVTFRHRGYEARWEFAFVPAVTSQQPHSSRDDRWFLYSPREATLGHTPEPIEQNRTVRSNSSWSSGS